jgi:hypothetical protein
VIGLGTATLAAYAQPGDYLRFYEINPDVIRLAEGDKGYFTYLSDTKGNYDIIAGDARVSLEKELEMGQEQNYDLFFIDAFSGDSVPVHLLTRGRPLSSIWPTQSPMGCLCSMSATATWISQRGSETG